MKRTMVGLALSLTMVLSLASPALAATGEEYGKHHSDHAVAEQGFTGDHNPGGMHKGFSGWMAE